VSDRGLAQTAGPRGSRTLPPAALQALREAFAGEVAVRLPRLTALLSAAPGPDALRDAHALGSSAVIVGEPDAARAARALEAELDAALPDRAHVVALVRQLAEQLEPWLHAQEPA
jgi:HPt (histidine-containing phosphotransfer) domain-containing protein